MLITGNDGILQKLIHWKLGGVAKLIKLNDGAWPKLIVFGKHGILQKLTHGNDGTIKLTGPSDGALPKLITGNDGA